MPKYFFNSDVDGHQTVDVLGLDLENEAAARKVARRIALRMADLTHDPSGCSIYVTEGGRLAFRVSLGDDRPMPATPDASTITPASRTRR